MSVPSEHNCILHYLQYRANVGWQHADHQYACKCIVSTAFTIHTVWYNMLLLTCTQKWMG